MAAFDTSGKCLACLSISACWGEADESGVASKGQATKFELVVNLKAAKLIDIELPTAILLGAHEVIE